jgi:hypothetical protein
MFYKNNPAILYDGVIYSSSIPVFVNKNNDDDDV